MANFYKINGDAVRVPVVSADLGSPLDGTVWYNSTSGEIKFRQNGVTVVLGQVSSEFTDASFRVIDDGDASKKIAFEASGLTTSTTRTITMPDTNIDLGQIATNTSAIAGKQDPISGSAAIDVTADTVSLTLNGSSYLDQTSGLKAEVVADYASATAGSLMDSADIKTAVDLKADTTALADYIPLTQKAANNGVASLDAGGKIPSAQLPSSVMDFLGMWAASTNTPSLANGTGSAGDVYLASDAGSVDFGAGSISFVAGDWVVYSGTIWEKSINSNAVVSVNTQTGVVVLDTGDVAENGSLYFTNARVLASALTGFAAGADSTILAADSVLAAFQKAQGQINARLSSVSEDTAPALGGNLTLGANQVIHDASGIQKGQVAGDTYFDDYDHALSLSASTTAVIAAMTVAHATYDAQKIDYKIASASEVRVGSIFLATNGVDVSISDTYSETDAMDISFSAAINGSDIEISYNNSSIVAATMRAQSRRFKA